MKRYALEKLPGSDTLLPVIRDSGEWVKFADVQSVVPGKDLRAFGMALINRLQVEISDMVAKGRQPPPEGLFAPAIAEALAQERERCRRLALKPLGGLVIAAMIADGSEP